MQIKQLDHVNLRTTRLDEMVAWYRDVLGLTTGKRPDFSFPGAWIYIGDQPAIHLVGVAQEAAAADSLKLEHFAMSATGFDELVERLKEREITYSVDPVPGFPIVQINCHDPDGNHIHIDFHNSEVSDVA